MSSSSCLIPYKLITTLGAKRSRMFRCFPLSTQTLTNEQSEMDSQLCSFDFNPDAMDNDVYILPHYNGLLINPTIRCGGDVSIRL